MARHLVWCRRMNIEKCIEWKCSSRLARTYITTTSTATTTSLRRAADHRRALLHRKTAVSKHRDFAFEFSKIIMMITMRWKCILSKFLTKAYNEQRQRQPIHIHIHKHFCFPWHRFQRVNDEVFYTCTAYIVIWYRRTCLYFQFAICNNVRMVNVPETLAEKKTQTKTTTTTDSSIRIALHWILIGSRCGQLFFFIFLFASKRCVFFLCFCWYIALHWAWNLYCVLCSSSLCIIFSQCNNISRIHSKNWQLKIRIATKKKKKNEIQKKKTEFIKTKSLLNDEKKNES